MVRLLRVILVGKSTGQVVFGERKEAASYDDLEERIPLFVRIGLSLLSNIKYFNVPAWEVYSSEATLSMQVFDCDPGKIVPLKISLMDEGAPAKLRIP